MFSDKSVSNLYTNSITINNDDLIIKNINTNTYQINPRFLLKFASTLHNISSGPSFSLHETQNDIEINETYLIDNDNYITESGHSIGSLLSDSITSFIYQHQGQMYDFGFKYKIDGYDDPEDYKIYPIHSTGSWQLYGHHSFQPYMTFVIPYVSNSKYIRIFGEMTTHEVSGNLPYPTSSIPTLTVTYNSDNENVIQPIEFPVLSTDDIEKTIYYSIIIPTSQPDIDTINIKFDYNNDGYRYLAIFTINVVLGS